MKSVSAHSLIVALNDGRPSATRNLIEALVIFLGVIALGFVAGIAMAAYKTEIEKVWGHIR